MSPLEAPSTPSRRSFLKVTTAAAAVTAVGWSAAQGTWVTAASAQDLGAQGAAPVPRLDGSLDTSRAALARASEDFGEIVRNSPRAVLRPKSVRDISVMIDYCRRNQLTIAMSGQSGTGTDLESHSSYGQALVPGGISIDAKGLRSIRSISGNAAVVDAGVTWGELVDAALARGLTPATLTDYVHLSIGGTISVGGIGGTVQKYGLQCDTVDSITIVTGTGEVCVASRSRNADLFEAALAGGGQVGIIVSATVRLVPAPARAALMNLYYEDLGTYMADQERILADGRFSHQEGEVIRKPDDSGWRYKIEAVTYYTGAAPDRGRLLAGLRDKRSDAEFQDYTYRDWIFRIDPFEAFLKEGGYWNQPKPWLSLVLPASRTRQFISSVVPELTPDDLGAGFSGFYPFPRSRLTHPLFATPNEPTLYLFDLLRFPAPGSNTTRMLEQNRRFYDRGVAIGAKRYLVGAVPRMTQRDWQTHFGTQYSRLTDAKRRYDPSNVLTPGQGFFGGGR